MGVRVLGQASIVIAVLLCLSISMAKDKPTIPTSESECVAKGGAWTTLGLPYPDKPKVCDLKATDAGIACSDSKGCEGVCLAAESTPTGTKATGRCSPYVRNFGNLLLIKNGVVEQFNVE